MKKCHALIITFSFVLTSCGKFYLPLNSDEPSKKSFAYYDKNYRLDSNSKLVVHRNYNNVRTDSSVCVIRFFQDGALNMFFGTSMESFPDDDRNKQDHQGVDLGYYRLAGDSLYFTTKSFYNHKQQYYRGLIKKDSLFLQAHDKNYNILRNEVYFIRQLL